MSTFCKRNIGIMLIGSIIFLIGSSVSASTLFHTDFDATVHDIDPTDGYPDYWSNPVSANWSLVNDEFSGTSGPVYYGGYVDNGTVSSWSLTDYTVSATFRKEGESVHGGVIGRVQNAGTFYHLRIDGTDQNLQLYTFNPTVRLATIVMDEAYVTGESWKLSMSFDGADILGKVYNANNALVGMLTVNDSTFAGGPAGFRILGGAFVAEDFTINSIPPYPIIPGDANSDGVVNSADASILAMHWLQTSGAAWSDGDFNEDGMVDDIDGTLLATNWSDTVLASVPEPSMLVILCGILPAFFLWRKNR